jgi:hypothetical protein
LFFALVVINRQGILISGPGKTDVDCTRFFEKQVGSLLPAFYFFREVFICLQSVACAGLAQLRRSAVLHFLLDGLFLPGDFGR